MTRAVLRTTTKIMIASSSLANMTSLHTGRARPLPLLITIAITTTITTGITIMLDHTITILTMRPLPLL